MHTDRQSAAACFGPCWAARRVMYYRALEQSRVHTTSVENIRVGRISCDATSDTTQLRCRLSLWRLLSHTTRRFNGAVDFFEKETGHASTTPGERFNVDLTRHKSVRNAILPRLHFHNRVYVTVLRSLGSCVHTRTPMRVHVYTFDTHWTFDRV